ncbi:MAG: phosphodiester glycosidase family protein [Eubacteriales bacterium]|nr:phosphodiester glycosidase family protein [Eubacteriales bacterium]
MRRPYAYAGLFALFLAGLTAFFLLDTFVLPHALSAAATATPEGAAATPTASPAPAAGEAPAATAQPTAAATPVPTALVTDTAYRDGSISVTLTTLREYDTDIYVADVVLSDASQLKTALASDTFGLNVTEKASVMAQTHDAVLAVNGDYYGANARGYVIKNGVLYRQTVRSDSAYDDLAVYADGSFAIVNEAETTAQALLDAGVQQLFAFGPALVENSEISVSTREEVGQAMTSNPRTAIGMVSPLHYVFVVSDGRTSQSAGLSLYQLAQVLRDAGCTCAYNLGGGGSSTMVFNGEVVNNPTTGGKRSGERAVSDIVYIG